MTEPAPAASEPIPPASISGRVGKLLVGSLQLLGCASVLLDFDYLQQNPWSVDSLTMGQVAPLWIFVLFAFGLLRFTVNLGFRRPLNLGYRPLWIALGALVVVAGVEVLRTGAVWTPLLATLILTITLYVHLHLGLSHVLAAVTGIDGCEMRVIPYYLSRWLGSGSAELHICPGLWTPIDRWEQRLRSGGTG